MVRDTYINFQWLLFILVGKIYPPMQEHFFPASRGLLPRRERPLLAGKNIFFDLF